MNIFNKMLVKFKGCQMEIQSKSCIRIGLIKSIEIGSNIIKIQFEWLVKSEVGPDWGKWKKENELKHEINLGVYSGSKNGEHLFLKALDNSEIATIYPKGLKKLNPAKIKEV